MDGDDFASIQLLGTLNDGFKSNDFNIDVAKYFKIFQEDSVIDHSFSLNEGPECTNPLGTISSTVDKTQACHVVFHPNDISQQQHIQLQQQIQLKMGSTIKQEYQPSLIYAEGSFLQQDDLHHNLNQQQQPSMIGDSVQYFYYDSNNLQQSNQKVFVGNNNLLITQNIITNDDNYNTNGSCNNVSTTTITSNGGCGGIINDNSVLLVPESQTKPLINTNIKCQNCNLRFKSQETHDNHARCHSQNGISGFNCYLCEFTRKKWASLANHLWSAHKIDMELSKCDKCEYRTYSQSILDRVHLATHSEERNFLCETCDKRFKTIKQLQNHKSTHNGDIKPKPVTRSCETCHKELKDKKSLDKHIKVVHNRVKNHPCTLCSYKAHSRGTLLTHIRAQHTGEKPHRCQFDQCQFSTSDHNSFRRHKLRHEGHYPYNCPFCDYRSIQSCSYKDHLKKHKKEPRLTEYLFTCENCGFTTINKSKLTSHQFACNKSDAENNLVSSDECSIGSASSFTSNIIASAVSTGRGIVTVSRVPQINIKNEITM